MHISTCPSTSGECTMLCKNVCVSINQSIMALLKYDKTHIMTKYVLIRVLKKHAN